MPREQSIFLTSFCIPLLGLFSCLQQHGVRTRNHPERPDLPSELAGLSSSHIHSDDIPSLLLLLLVFSPFKNSSLSLHIFAWITHRSVINPNDLTARCFVLIKRSGKATVGGHLLGTVFAFCRHREQERVKQQGYDGAGRAANRTRGARGVFTGGGGWE